MFDRRQPHGASTPVDPAPSNPAASVVPLIDRDYSFSKYTRLVKRMTGAHVALITFVDEPGDRQVFKAHLGLPAPVANAGQTPLKYSFCKVVKAINAPLVVDDTTKDDRVWHNPSINEFNITAYLGVPIHDEHWAPVGALCALAVEPRRWSEVEIDTMQDLSACVTDQIQLRAGFVPA